MANLSLRGLDASTLSRIRSRARHLKLSVNRLIVETLRQHYAPEPRRKDQIDELAGSWTRQEADEFDEAVKPFSEVDPALWASEPTATYRARVRRPAAKRKSRA